MQEALNMVDDNGKTSGHRILRYLSQKTLKPFIFKDKVLGHFNPLTCYDGNNRRNIVAFSFSYYVIFLQQQIVIFGKNIYHVLFWSIPVMPL